MLASNQREEEARMAVLDELAAEGQRLRLLTLGSSAIRLHRTVHFLPSFVQSRLDSEIDGFVHYSCTTLLHRVV